MIEDTELLRRYAEEKSEAAFAELVQRRLNFVYACALRRVGGNSSLAEDVTQQVFTVLAREAGTLARRETLGGWLFLTTRFASARVARTERRRATHEQAAHFMNELIQNSAAPADWETLRPVLDGALDELNERDREAVIMRFFEQRSFAEVAEKFQLTENAARMRVERALDKLHGLLARRGLTSTAAALGLALTGQGTGAAPAGLAAAVTGAALAGGAAAVMGGGAAAVGTFMTMTKLQLTVASALAVAGATGFVLQGRENAELRDEIASLHRAGVPLAALRAENIALARTMAEATDVRRDDAELARLRDEAAALQTRAQGVAVAEKKRAAEWKPVWSRPADGLILAQELGQKPVVLTPIRPALDPRGARIEGEVVVDFVVDADGSVAYARAIRSSHRELEGLAVESVGKTKFTPGSKDGRAVPTHLQVPVILDNGPQTPAPAAKTAP